MKVVVFLALLFLPALAQARPCEKYGLGAVLGTVHRMMFYGPPNFGENPKTDERGYYPVLKLDRVKRMCADDTGFADHPVMSHEMQMIFYKTPEFDKFWYGKHVAVYGDMFAADNGMHHTPVMLSVKSIRVIP